MSIRQQDLASRVEWLWRERLRGEEEGVETVQGINRWANTEKHRHRQDLKVPLSIGSVATVPDGKT